MKNLKLHLDGGKMCFLLLNHKYVLCCLPFTGHMLSKTVYLHTNEIIHLKLDPCTANSLNIYIYIVFINNRDFHTTHCAKGLWNVVPRTDAKRTVSAVWYAYNSQTMACFCIQYLFKHCRIFSTYMHFAEPWRLWEDRLLTSTFICRWNIGSCFGNSVPASDYSSTIHIQAYQLGNQGRESFILYTIWPNACGHLPMTPVLESVCGNLSPFSWRVFLTPGTDIGLEDQAPSQCSNSIQRWWVLNFV